MSERYQNIYINKNRSLIGVRECDSRYQLIKSFCLSLNRDFSLLDIGANYGYFSIRLALDFPNSNFVLIEKDPIVANACKEICLLNKINNIIILNYEVNTTILQELEMAEHFNIVLALSIVHHFNQKINTVIDQIKRIGEYTIFELPSKNEKACNQELINHIDVPDDLEKIGECISHTANIQRYLYLYRNINKEFFVQRRLFHKDSKLDTTIKITFENQKYFISNKRKNEKLPFLLGLNLYTFILLNGIYPLRLSLVETLLESKILHKDPTPWNYIIHKNNLCTIDNNDINTNDESNKMEISTNRIIEFLLYEKPIIIIKNWFEYLGV